MKWITVTTPEGNQVGVAIEHIVRVRPAARREGSHITAKAYIDLASGGWQETVETVDQIMSKIMPLEK